MLIESSQIVSLTAVNQNFSVAAKLVSKKGTAYVFKRNRPKYVLIDLDKEVFLNLTDDEKIDVVAKRILNKFRPAFEELAK